MNYIALKDMPGWKKGEVKIRENNGSIYFSDLTDKNFTGRHTYWPNEVNWLVQNDWIKPVDEPVDEPEWEEIHESNTDLISDPPSIGDVKRLMEQQNQIIRNQKYLKAKMEEKWTLKMNCMA